MPRDINSRDLDNWITGHYGEDQFRGEQEDYPEDEQQYITVADLANFRLGKTATSEEDFQAAGLPMIGGCEICHATIGPGNAYPSVSGFLRCDDCIDGDGYETVEYANQKLFGQ